MSELSLADKVVALHRGLGRARLEHAFGGALALAYYATPRATIDIDVNIFVSPARYGACAAVLRKLGAGTIPAPELAARDGQVRAWWGRTPVDMFFSYDPVHEAMREWTRPVPFGKGEIPILSPEHLLVAKVAFDRAKDWIDIEQILVAVDDLDLEEIRRWLAHLMGGDSRVARFNTLVSALRGTS